MTNISVAWAEQAGPRQLQHGDDFVTLTIMPDTGYWPRFRAMRRLHALILLKLCQKLVSLAIQPRPGIRALI